MVIMSFFFLITGVCLHDQGMSVREQTQSFVYIRITLYQLGTNLSPYGVTIIKLTCKRKRSTEKLSELSEGSHPSVVEIGSHTPHRFEASK